MTLVTQEAGGAAGREDLRNIPTWIHSGGAAASGRMTPRSAATRADSSSPSRYGDTLMVTRATCYGGLVLRTRVSPNILRNTTKAAFTVYLSGVLAFTKRLQPTGNKEVPWRMCAAF